jgi:hypothetical protein
MGWPRNGRDFNIHWLVGETMHVNIQHNKDGRFANVTHVIKDPAIISRALVKAQADRLPDSGLGMLVKQ